MIKFGFNSTQLEPIARDLEALLKIRFKLHESDYCGGDYYRAEVASGLICLQKNYDLIDEEPFETEWPNGYAILYLDGLDDQEWESFVKRFQAAAQQIGATYLGE